MTEDLEMNNNHHNAGDINKQIQEEFKGKFYVLKKVQEEIIDEFGGLVKRIKNKNKEIGNELDSQAPLLNSLGNEVL